MCVQLYLYVYSFVHVCMAFSMCVQFIHVCMAFFMYEQLYPSVHSLAHVYSLSMSVQLCLCVYSFVHVSTDFSMCV